jgi:hypothetical protein
MHDQAGRPSPRGRKCSGIAFHPMPFPVDAADFGADSFILGHKDTGLDKQRRTARCHGHPNPSGAKIAPDSGETPLLRWPNQRQDGAAIAV